jgi:hypothetical protein
MPHWDDYLCLFELEAARRNCSTDTGDRLRPGAASPTSSFPWPFGAALLLVALSTMAAALWHS